MKKTSKTPDRLILVLGTETLRKLTGGSGDPRFPPSSNANSDMQCCTDFCGGGGGGGTSGGTFYTGFAAGCETIQSQHR